MDRPSRQARSVAQSTSGEGGYARTLEDLSPRGQTLSALAQMARDTAAPTVQGSGLPPRLKAGVESLSGVSLDHVRVHYASPAPAQLNALAYAQGRDIHLAAGQERYLAHEAWHVAQQAQGRAPPTAQLRSGAAINDDPVLEAEADAMGRRALEIHADPRPLGAAAGGSSVIQRVIPGLGDFTDPSTIAEDWVEAFIRDIAVPMTHLYEADMRAYLDAREPGWRERADFDWVDNHWNVTFKSGSLVETSLDGDCGAHAIHAIMTLDGSTDAKGHTAPADFILEVREWISQLAAGAREEVRARIAQEIAGNDNVPQTGFGPELSAILTPYQQRAAREAEEAGEAEALRALMARMSVTGSDGDRRSNEGGSGDGDGGRLGQARETFGGRSVGPIDLEGMPVLAERATAFAAEIEAIRADIQDWADHAAPGQFKCIVRFHVKDDNVGKTHPGLNSWAHLAKQQGKVIPDLDPEERAKLAQQHMDHGHDVPGEEKNGLIAESPFISGSDDASSLIKADSPYNTERRKAMISDAGIKEFIPKDQKAVGRSKSLLSKTVARSVAAKLPPKTAGKFVSDRIVALTHGMENAVLAKALKLPVATHVAFLLVPVDRVYKPPPTTSPDMCCVLEHEVTVYAPDIDMVEFLVLELENQLPELTSRFR